MNGRNPKRKVDRGDGSRLWVQEVFPTVQGEGPFSGERAVFVRLSGCTLACFWCDTEFESSTWVPTVPELVASTLGAFTWDRDRLVVLTGGEPLRQPVGRYVSELLSQGIRVQVETSGTAWLGDLPDHPNLSIVVSPKTAVVLPEVRERALAWKYIARAGELSEEDGLPLASTQHPGKPVRLARPPSGARVYLGPCDEHDAAKNEANGGAVAAACLAHGYLAYVQTHKVLGAP